jgi:uncharacterized membrane protein YoaK (UPF0700 family)
MTKNSDVHEQRARREIWSLPMLGRDGMLLLLTWAAGSVDAVSYLGLGHVFTAMMTGNTVLLGLAIGQGQALAALRSVIALAGFCLGAAVGAFIVERDKKQQDWPPAVTGALALEGITLGLFAIIWHFTDPTRSAGTLHVLILLSGLAMGIQAAAVRHLGVPGIATTYITGTLTSLMVDLTRYLRTTAVRSLATTSPGETVPGAASALAWERRVGLLAAVFLVYGLGALAGSILQVRSSSLVTLSPLAAVGLVVINASWLQWRQRHTSHG